MAPWLLDGRHVVAFPVSLGVTVSLAAFVWLFYVAVEPFVRRRWPGMLVAWVRVLAGNVRDPLVGRDVLIGCASGVAGACLTDLDRLAAWQAGQPGALLVPDWNMFSGPAAFVASVLAHFDRGLFVSLLMLFILFLLRVVLRSRLGGHSGVRVDRRGLASRRPGVVAGDSRARGVRRASHVRAGACRRWWPRSSTRSCGRCSRVLQ